MDTVVVGSTIYVVKRGEVSPRYLNKLTTNLAVLHSLRLQIHCSQLGVTTVKSLYEKSDLLCNMTQESAGVN
jgi:hypothetical protein